MTAERVAAPSEIKAGDTLDLLRHSLDGRVHLYTKPLSFSEICPEQKATVSQVDGRVAFAKCPNSNCAYSQTVRF